MSEKEQSPVESAAAHVEHVKKALARVIGWAPFNGKGKAIAAVRRELVEAEGALGAAKKAEAKSAPVVQKAPAGK